MKYHLLIAMLLSVFCASCGKQQKADDNKKPPAEENAAEVKSDASQDAKTSDTETDDNNNLEATRVEVSVRGEAALALRHATAYLVDSQQDNGSWGEHAGTTALCSIVLLQNKERHEKAKAAADKALAYIRGQITDTGKVKGSPEGKDIYSAAACLWALIYHNNKADEKHIELLHASLVKSQLQTPGFSYTTTRYPDLSNTHWALEAIYLYKQRYPEKVDDKEKKMWHRARDLVLRCQHDNGGFSYYPVDQKEDVSPHENTTGIFGSLTLGALKSLNYAGLKKDHESIQKGLDWFEKNVSLTENPGLDKGGLYYYYYMLASTLKVLDVKALEKADGTVINWRQRLLETLLATQSKGAWQNTNRLWLEHKPALCTAYSMLAIHFALD